MTETAGDTGANAGGRPVRTVRAARRGGGNRRERREQTRTALLEAAERLWAERGIHGASLDDIASSAGLTKGAVYSNFAGKTDLLLALLERYTGDGVAESPCQELHDTEHPPETRFARAGRAYARRLAGEDARLRTLLLVEFWLYGMRDYAAGWRIADWYADRRGRLSRRLRGRGDLAPGDLAALVVALDIGLTFQHLLDPERVPAELYAKGVRVLLDGALS